MAEIDIVIAVIANLAYLIALSALRMIVPFDNTKATAIHKKFLFKETSGVELKRLESYFDSTLYLKKVKDTRGRHLLLLLLVG